MKKEENLNEEVEVKEETAIAVNDESNYQVMDFGGIGKNSNTKTEVYTNITDEKKIFNLENKVDFMLNDCENELIRVKDILIKRFEKPLKDPVIDEETGEVLKDKEFSMSCVLVDNLGKSYATGSKSFIIQLMRYLQMQSRMQVKPDMFEIKIIKKKINTGNKVLSFELV